MLSSNTKPDSSVPILFQDVVVPTNGSIFVDDGVERKVFQAFASAFARSKEDWDDCDWSSFIRGLCEEPAISSPHVEVLHTGLPFRNDHDLTRYLQSLLFWSERRLTRGLTTRIVFLKSVRAEVEARISTNPRFDELQLARIQKRADAAQPGPWRAFVEDRDMWGGDTFIKMAGEDLYLTNATVDDHDFIANARQDVPNLVAEVRRLRAILAKAGLESE